MPERVLTALISRDRNRQPKSLPLLQVRRDWSMSESHTAMPSAVREATIAVISSVKHSLHTPWYRVRANSFPTDRHRLFKESAMVLEKSALAQFTGTENYYRHWLGRFKYTDGVHYVAESGAHWLLDAIASHQTRQLL